MILYTFTNGFKQLSDFYGKKLSSEQLALWQNKVSHINDSVFLRAVEIAINEEKFFPTPNQFFRHVSTAQHEMVRAKNLEEESFARKAFSDGVDAREGRHGRIYIDECKCLLKKSSAFGGAIAGIELASEMYDMDKKYQNLGWDREARKVLVSFYKRQGMKESEYRNLLP